MWRRWPKRFLSQQTPKELFSRNLYIIRYIHSYQKEGQKACLYGDDNGIFVLSEQGRWWPYSAFVRSEAMTATFVWQKISRHILYSFFFLSFFLIVARWRWSFTFGISSRSHSFGSTFTWPRSRCQSAVTWGSWPPPSCRPIWTFSYCRTPTW